MSKRTSKNIKILSIILVVALIASLSWVSFTYYNKYNKLSNVSPEEFQKQRNGKIINTVSKVYALPKDEDPVVALLSDKDTENIKKQYPVLDSAEKGDYLLVYQKSKKAILFRPSSNQVIKEVPVSVSNNLRVKVVGSGSVRSKIEKLLADDKISFSDGGVSKTVINGVTIVDLTGKNTDTAKALAEKLKGQTGSTPEGEDKQTDADIVIYTNQDQQP